MSKPLNLVGQVFGRLLVLRRLDSDRQGRTMWLCHCSCGKETKSLGVYLTSGEKRSCGCLHRDVTIAKGQARKIDLTGQVFGRLKVLGPGGKTSGKGEYLWDCQCSCGKTHKALGNRLRRGSCLSCGCLRDELMKARAREVGSKKRLKACRTCGNIYEAVGPQKECSLICKRRWHAADEARRRQRSAMLEVIKEATELGHELNKRLKN